MRLAMFTPATTASAIGRVAALVSRALVVAGHRVTIVRTEDLALLNAPAHDFGAPVRAWNEWPTIARLVHEADCLVYHVGDNNSFHRGALEWMATAPGVVCLHDHFVGHLFTEWGKTRPGQAGAIVEACYGKAVAARYFGHATSAELIEATRLEAPMAEWIAAMATGVIVHSGWDLPRVERACPGPIHLVPLACDAPAATGHPGAADGAADRPFTILTVGNVNPNKRIDRVLEAIGGSESLRRAVEYRLVGSVRPDESARLAALARGLGVSLVVSGEVDSATLGEAFAAADVVACLRLPVLEGASASAIEALLHGKPTIVMDAGFYAELPDDCVLKVDPSREIADLRGHLEALRADGAARFALGHRAARWAAATFRADNYAERLVAVCQAASQAAPTISAGRFFAGVLAGWGTSFAAIDDPILVDPLAIFERRRPVPDTTPT